MQYARTTALVTGASSGIGAEFARTLARRGADLVLVARRSDLLETLASEVRDASGRVVHTVATDLTADGAGHDLARRVSSSGLSVDTVVNAAGAGRTEDFSTSDAAAIHQQIALNIGAVVDVSHAFLPQLLDSGRGALVNVASLTGYVPVPGMAVYAASKAFVIRFTEALAHETRASGTTVLAVSPGPTRTGFYAGSRTDTTGVRFQTPAQVVATTLAALQRRRPPASVVSGVRNRLTRRVVELVPTRWVLQMAESTPAR